MSDKQESKPTEDLPPQQSRSPLQDAIGGRLDPFEALYAPSSSARQKDFKIYDNLAQFDAALKRLGVFAVGSKTAPPPKPQPKPTTAEDSKYLNIPGRRFLAHQAPIPTKGAKPKHSRSLFIKMEDIEGPMAAFWTYVEKGQRVKVYTRKEKGVRGITTGILKIFDKNWNIVLEDACEVWKRRKYKYSETPVCTGEAKDCSHRLRKLGIRLPKTEVKSVHRKYVECSRRIKQLMIRGEQIVLITPDDGQKG
ncbi:unnamed protein product [Hermetia illucens]|uniref:Sm domain-containing protein n=1 Tax=Hermetia illucens TaxID=343691 RepID=A0A7R8UMG8_HERIL|nr:U7 snRNA-associated Sm-like protein LSm11 [Hermetia illucens]CAD7083531.1 unnamed protein product [Hermetia illucens]